MPDWPEWCWLPMGATHAILTSAGGHGTDIARVAAVGQWRLTGRHIVTPSEEVAEHAVPRQIDTSQPLADQVAAMTAPIPREEILDALAGACYYLVTPVPPPDPMPRLWVYGCYMHLEYDMNTGRPELRLLPDTGDGWDLLSAAPVHLDQPTLDWSATSAANVMSGPLAALLSGPDARLLADYMRTLTWAVWPYIGGLIDERAQLVGPRILNDPGLDAMARGASSWELTYTRKSGGHLRPV